VGRLIVEVAGEPPLLQIPVKSVPLQRSVYKAAMKPLKECVDGARGTFCEFSVRTG
jgi:hypothetical protein